MSLPVVAIGATAEFALDLSQVDTDFIFKDDSVIELEMNSIGVLYREAISSRLSSAFHIGINDDSIDSSGASMSLDGQYAGIDFDLNLTFDTVE